jgi:putative membrane protein
MYRNKPGWIVRWLVIAVSIMITAWLLPGIVVKGGVLDVLILALVLGLLNLIVRPILIFLSLPAVVVTLGFFLLIINALMLSWASSITGTLEIHGFGWTLLGALLITIISTILLRSLGPKSKSPATY